MKVAINGFGRIGRIIFKLCLDKGINVVAINDIGEIKNLVYLLKYDSVYGRYDKKVSIEGNKIVISGKRFWVFNEKNPERLPWKKVKVDVVVESTGVFTEAKKAEAHLMAGAKKVVITAPSENADITLIPGVNNNELKRSHKIISVASCTTNALALVIKVLDDSFGVERGFFNTVHGYTASQNIVDGSNKKLRRGRAGAVNIIPTTSGASKATCEAMPKMKNNLDGLALRVPVVTGSIVDFVAILKKEATKEEINFAFKKSSEEGLKGILGYTEDEIVSTDVIGDSRSSIIDGLSTQSFGSLARVLAWYDNEYGYCNRVIDVLKRLK